jgi:hypothetical protein
MMKGPSLSAVAGALALACAVATPAAHAALASAVDPATGTLLIGFGAAGDKNFKVEVASGGRVTVIDNSGGTPAAVYSNIGAIRVTSGAGFDQIEFDIDSSQSLALALDTGSGDAIVKLQWKVPAGAAATQSTLAMASGGGSVSVELDFESETPSSQFGWTTRFGGGNKALKGKLQFKPGTVDASQNIDFAQLGGGTHQVTLEVDSDAQRADLRLNAGFAQEVNYKVVSDSPSPSLRADTTVRGAKNNVEILSAAASTVTRLAGGTANLSDAETNYAVVQTVAGAHTATLQHAALGASSSRAKFKFDGPAATLSLGGLVRGSIVADQILIESNMPTATSLAVEAGGGNDTVEFLVAGRLSGSAGLPRFALGDGDDSLKLAAGAGSSATPAIDCGAGNDSATASLGTPSGCEQFSR